MTDVCYYYPNMLWNLVNITVIFLDIQYFVGSISQCFVNVELLGKHNLTAVIMTSCKYNYYHSQICIIFVEK